jgi:hypothetical protein
MRRQLPDSLLERGVNSRFRGVNFRLARITPVQTDDRLVVRQLDGTT